ncbi:MAG: DUF1570 domain-containing protein, partial [Polyangiaceae bacterium]
CAPAASRCSASTTRHRRIEEGKRELGEKTSYGVVEDTFVIFGEPTFNDGGFKSSIALVKQTLAAYFNKRFGTRPSEAISVYLFWSKPTYDAYCQKTWHEPCLSIFGFFRPQERRIVMNAAPGLGTLTHELVHPIVETDFPNAPTWVNEGIASLFEAPAITRPGEIHGVKNWRLPRLRTALASQKPTEKSARDLDHLFTISDETFRGTDEDLNYATARYFCQWMDERGLLWRFYQTWRDGQSTGMTAQMAFTSVTGESTGDASAKWVRWVGAL